MPRVSYLEMSQFGEGEPIMPSDIGMYQEHMPQRLAATECERIAGRLSIQTLLYQQGYNGAVAADLANGFDRVFTASLLLGNQAMFSNTFYSYSLDDLSDAGRQRAAGLIERVAQCAAITADLSENGMPLWRQGITLYGVANETTIQIAKTTRVQLPVSQ